MRIDEQQVLGMLDGAQNVLLIEPAYKRKYVPLALAKIAARLRSNGTPFAFARAYKPGDWDLICVTSLFTYDSQLVLNVIREARFLGPDVPIIVGGVFASLMPQLIHAEKAMVFEGCSEQLDATPPVLDYSWGVDPPWDDFSFVFTSRGCPNKCAYCAVWRIEPKRTLVHNWRDHIADDKPNVMVSDNNLSACSLDHITEVAEFLRDRKKKVVFDNGFDCKHVTDDLAKLLAQLKYTRAGLRLAFDRIEEDTEFKEAIARLRQAGIPKSATMAYVLFNFTDTPADADYRMRTCADLGVRPYPQQYVPLTKLSRKPAFVGKHWTSGLLRAFRWYWLMAGVYTKAPFEAWAITQDKFSLSSEDWAAWAHT